MTTDPTAAIEVLARLLCTADVHVYGDDHPTLQQLSTTLGRSVQDDYRKAARWLLPRITVATKAAVSVPPPTRADDRADVLNAAAQHLYTALFPAVYDDMGQKAAEGVNRAVSELRRMADEAQQQPQTPASTAPLAAGLPLVKGRCPACGRASLFLGSGGYVTCSVVDCREPDAATTVLEQPAAVPGRVADEEPTAETPFIPPAHYVRDDGVECCVHAIPVGPDSCSHCRELADDERPR